MTPQPNHANPLPADLAEALAARVRAGRASAAERAELERHVDASLALIASGEAEIFDSRPPCCCCGKPASLRCDDCGDTAACAECVVRQEAGFHCTLCGRFQCDRCCQAEANINPHASGDHYREHLTGPENDELEQTLARLRAQTAGGRR